MRPRLVGIDFVEDKLAVASSVGYPAMYCNFEEEQVGIVEEETLVDSAVGIGHKRKGFEEAMVDFEED
jgi:hypothetical protein